jgi:hypothetical protein
MNKVTFREMLEGLASYYKGYKKIDPPLVRSWYEGLKDLELTDSDIIKAVTSRRDDDNLTDFPSFNVFKGECEVQKHIRIGPVHRSEPLSPASPPQIPSFDKAQSQDCLRAVMRGIQYGKEAGVEAMTKLADKYPSNRAGLLVSADEIGKWEN